MKVRTKLGLLHFLVVAIFIGGLLAIKGYDRQKFREVSLARAEERRISFDDFLAHWSEPLRIFVKDDSTWDEMVKAIANRDLSWAEAKLNDDAQASSRAHAIWAYDAEGKLAFTRNLLYSEAIGEVPLPPGALALMKGGRYHFFAFTPLGLMEISGSTVHPSKDTDHQTPARGTFFAGRIWSNLDLRDMSIFTGNAVQIENLATETRASTPASEELNNPRVSFTRGLPGWDGAPVARLVVSNDSPVVEQLKRSSDRQFFGLIAFSLILFFVLVVSLTRWVSRPLKRLSRGLRSQKLATLEPLQNKRDEFGDLARMMSTFFEQREALLREISERRQVQEALHESEERLRHSQKMEAIGRLAGGIAHDFNNLLTAIIGYAELIGLRTREESTREEAGLIRKAGDQAANLTRQLLAFSRKQILQPRILDLNALVRDMQKLLLRVIGEEINLRFEAGAQRAQVSADPTQIEQVVINLAVNARDAMPRGGVLTMRTGDLHLEAPLEGAIILPPGRYLTLTVQDTGTGMDAETQARIFEPFFTTKGPGKGTGLGLATVYGILQQSGGTVQVSSKLGEGTAFTIYLPDADLPLDPPLPQIPPVEKVMRFETVLVVEDEMMVRELVCAVLAEQGYHVLCAASGPEALDVAAKYPGEIELLVSDVVMPHMTGPDCARELLRSRPETRVLFVSGYSEADISEDGVLAPGVNLLPKPFTPKALSSRVREVLDEVAPPVTA